MVEIRHIVDCKNYLGEGPLWDVEEQRLYWIDSCAAEIWSCREDGSDVQRYFVPLHIGSMAVRKGGGAVVALANGFSLYDFKTQKLTHISDPEADEPENRMNDGKVDRRGRFFAGYMSYDHDREDRRHAASARCATRRSTASIRTSRSTGRARHQMLQRSVLEPGQQDLLLLSIPTTRSCTPTTTTSRPGRYPTGANSLRRTIIPAPSTAPPSTRKAIIWNAHVFGGRHRPLRARWDDRPHDRVSRSGTSPASCSAGRTSTFSTSPAWAGR